MKGRVVFLFSACFIAMISIILLSFCVWEEETR
jgi:hypothetical protein